MALGECCCCRISYYSWWLPPPRRLGAAEEAWQELVIVLGHLLVICEGFLCLPRGRFAKVSSSKLLVSLSYLHLWSASGGVHYVDGVCGNTQIATKPPSVVGRHNGDVPCRQASEPREKINLSLLSLLVHWISYCD